MSALSNDARRVAQLEKEAREKNAAIAKLRHDGESASRLSRRLSGLAQ